MKDKGDTKYVQYFQKSDIQLWGHSFGYKPWAVPIATLANVSIPVS